MLTAVRSKVMEGHTLAEGFAQFPRAFPELYRATVAAGEQTGHLEIVLERLADYTESRHYMRQKIQQAMFYPAGLVLVATGVVVLLLTYVVPQVTQVFSDMHQELPPLTRGLIALSGFLRHYGIVLLIGLVILVVAFIYGLKNENFRYGVHTILLRMPLVQRLIRGSNAGALRPHLQHPHRQRRERAGGIAHFRRGHLQPAHAPGRGRRRRQDPGGHRHQQGPGTQPPVPTHVAAPDRQRRGYRPPGADAGTRRPSTRSARWKALSAPCWGSWNRR